MWNTTDKRIMKEKDKEPLTWIALVGKWKFEEGIVSYLSPKSASELHPYGLAICSTRGKSGLLKATVKFKNSLKDSAARIVFGRNSSTDSYYSAGLGGYGFAYVITEFLPGREWRGVRLAGSQDNLEVDKCYNIELFFKGQKVRLSINGVCALEYDLPEPLSGDQLGLFTWGNEPVEFSNIEFETTRADCFVVTQYRELFDSLFEYVIKPTCKEFGLNAYRASDIDKPGIIFQDIVKGIIEAEVIIAEITPENANVFYELGYAHALKKTTILLAKYETELPFDIRSYRVIFYDDTIKGKSEVEETLRKHLANIMGQIKIKIIE